MKRFLDFALRAAILATLGVEPRVAPGQPLEGFGTDTPGGTNGERFVVTSLADSGRGTLRDAVSGSHRRIVFAVGGTIEVGRTIEVTGSYLTIDGSTAPPPGITITAAGPWVKSALVQIRKTSDVVVRHLRFRDAPDPRTGDGLRIVGPASNVVVDHCSFRRAGDGLLDVSDGAYDLTIQWSIFADAASGMLIRTGVRNLSLHHNLYAGVWERSPQIHDSGPVDVVNNVVYDWGSNYGTRIRNGATANLVKNTWIPGPRSDPKDALVILFPSLVYATGNRLPPTANGSGSVAARFAAPRVAEMAPAEALEAVLAGAGAQPRDAEDGAFAERVPRPTHER